MPCPVPEVVSMSPALSRENIAVELGSATNSPICTPSPSTLIDALPSMVTSTVVKAPGNKFKDEHTIVRFHDVAADINADTGHCRLQQFESILPAGRDAKGAAAAASWSANGVNNAADTTIHLAAYFARPSFCSVSHMLPTKRRKRREAGADRC